MRITLSRCHDDVFDQLVDARRAVNRTARLVVKRFGIWLFLVPTQPLISTGAADAELAAEHRNRFFPFANLHHELDSLLHGAALFPRHRRALLVGDRELSTMS
jgi:hypothetical protein